MHQPIKEHLEEILSGSASAHILAQFQNHLGSCEECNAEIQNITGHSRLFAAFRNGREVEPQVGFYARVMNRIELARPESFWTVFLQPMGRRLSYACVTLVLLMGTYLVSSEINTHSTPPSTGGEPTAEASRTQIDGDTIAPRQRDEILVSLASFRE